MALYPDNRVLVCLSENVDELSAQGFGIDSTPMGDDGCEVVAADLLGGGFYVATARVGFGVSGSVQRWSDGTMEWRYDLLGIDGQGSAFWTLAVSDDGDVVAGGERGDGGIGTTAWYGRYQSSGGLFWSRDEGSFIARSNVRNIAFLGDDLYILAKVDSELSLKKRNIRGQEVWSYVQSSAFAGTMAIDRAGIIHLLRASDNAETRTLLSFDPGGALVTDTEIAVPTSNVIIAADSEGDLLLLIRSEPNTSELRKLTARGVERWRIEIDVSEIAVNIAVDSTDSVLMLVNRGSAGNPDAVIRKYAP